MRAQACTKKHYSHALTHTLNGTQTHHIMHIITSTSWCQWSMGLRGLANMAVQCSLPGPSTALPTRHIPMTSLWRILTNTPPGTERERERERETVTNRQSRPHLSTLSAGKMNAATEIGYSIVSAQYTETITKVSIQMESTFISYINIHKHRTIEML